MTIDDLPKVALRGGFSDRMGIQPINTEIQSDDLDIRTRVKLDNTQVSLYDYIFDDNYLAREEFLLDVLVDVYLQPLSDLKRNQNRLKTIYDSFIDATIYQDRYDSVLTLIEFIAQRMTYYASNLGKQVNVYGEFNETLKSEYVGYRFVNDMIAPITSEIEVLEINTVIQDSEENIKRHFEKALAYMADRDNPDYENSIKESISAVEAMCSNILGTPGTLGEALKRIKKDKVITIHPALQEAFNKLYGYAGDADSGIRHAAKLGGSNSTFQEARFMLVACSAFVNYLKANLAELDHE